MDWDECYQRSRDRVGYAAGRFKASVDAAVCNFALLGKESVDGFRTWGSWIGFFTENNLRMLDIREPIHPQN